MSSILAKTVAWLVFLCGEYGIITMVVLPINAAWSFWQLLLLAPAALAAVWVFRPLVCRDAVPQTTARLFTGAATLFLFGLFACMVVEIVYRGSNSKQSSLSFTYHHAA